MNPKNNDYVPFKVLYDLSERKRKFARARENIAKQTSNDVVLIILEPHPRAKVLPLDNNRFHISIKQVQR